MPVDACLSARRLAEAGPLSRLLDRLGNAGTSDGDASTIVLEEISALYAPRPGVAALVEDSGRIRASADGQEVGSRFEIESQADVLAVRREGRVGVGRLGVSAHQHDGASVGSGGCAPLQGTGWLVIVPVAASGRSFGVVLVRTALAPEADQAREEAALLMGQVAAVVLTAAKPRARVNDSRSVSPRLPEGIERRPTPVWGVMAVPQTRPKRVVVIEDDADIAEGVRDALESDGYQVAVAGRADEGFMAARRTSPDLIILDVKLPDQDGFKVARDLWRDRRTANVPILFLSGLADLATRVRSLHSEEADFLPKPFSFKDLLTRVEQSLLRAEQRTRLLFSARQDELTGLGNLRLFEERLATEAARIDRYGTPLTIVVMDLDKLKTINDKYGHAAGSTALRAVGEVLRRAIRETDLAVRYGGDEFVVLLPHTELADGAAFAERILAQVSQLRPCGFSVSVSIGVASFDARVDATVDNLFERADQAAYRAKREGGGRLHVDAVVSSASGGHASPV